MRALIFTLFLTATFVLSGVSAHADDRTADYSTAPKPAKTVIQKRTTPAGNAQVKATDKSTLKAVDEVRKDFGYTSDEDLKQESEAAVLDGKDFTKRTTEQRRDSVPRVQELGF